jgi:hypothetical protein
MRNNSKEGSFLWGPFHTSKNPYSIYAMSPIILPFPELGLVYFNDDALTTDDLIILFQRLSNKLTKEAIKIYDGL